MRMKDVYREMLKQGDKYCYLAFDGAKIRIIINYIPNRDKKSSIKSILSNSCASIWKEGRKCGVTLRFILRTISH